MTYLEWLSERFRRGQGFAEENARWRRERLAANNGQEPPRVSLPHYLAAVWNGQGTGQGQNAAARGSSQPKSSGPMQANESGGLRSYFTEPPPPSAPQPPPLPEGVAVIRYAPGAPPLSKPVEDQLQREAGARGILTLDVYSTRDKVHAPNSNHYRGLAADINRVNNQPVMKYPYDPVVRDSVNAITQHANRTKAHEVFAPGPQTFKDGQTYRSADPKRQKALEDEHKDHVHITVSRNSGVSQRQGSFPSTKKRSPRTR